MPAGTDVSLKVEPRRPTCAARATVRLWNTLMEVPARPRPTFPIASWLLAVGVAWAAVWTLLPFRPVQSIEVLAQRLAGAVALPDGQALLATLLERLVVFVPIGILLHWRSARRRPHKRLRRTVGQLCVIVIALELLQVVTEKRHPSLWDAPWGLAAGLVGVYVSARLRPFRLSLQRIYRHHARRIIAGVLLIANFGIGCIVVAAHGGVDLNGWDSGFHLLLANERTGNRPWRGTIKGLALYAKTLTDRQAAQLAEQGFTRQGATLRGSLGPLTLYVLDQPRTNRIVRSLTGQPPLDLLLPEPEPSTWALSPNGLELYKPTLVESTTSAATLVEAIHRSNAFSVEIEVEIVDLTQTGPARIVSVSQSPKLRNFTIGQHRDRIDFRLRTRRTGLNGAGVTCRTRPGTLPQGWHHVVATYGNGITRLYVDGRAARRPLHLYSPASLLLGADSVCANALAAILLFAPVGILGGVLFMRRSWPIGVALGFGATALAPLILSATSAAWLRREQDFVFLIAATVTALLSASLYRALQGRS